MQDTWESVESVQPRIKHGMVLPFCPVTLSFRNIHYFVDLPAVRPSAWALTATLQLLLC